MFHTIITNIASLKTIDASQWKINGAVLVPKMFLNDSSLVALDLSNWDLTSAPSVLNMFGNNVALQQVKVGPKVVFINDSGNAALQDAPLNDTYTGKWVNLEGQTFTAAELMALYQNTPAAVADTYVWQTDQTAVMAHDSTVDQSGQNTWTAADNFDSATNATGQALTLADVTVTGSVDTTTPGTYQVTYQYLNNVGNPISSVATITVIASQVSVAAHDTTIMQGQAWTAADNFDSATDFDGHAVDLSDGTVTCADQVETQTPGTYDVSYRYTDADGNVATKVVMITVKASQVSVAATDQTVTQGQTWTAADSFVGATDAAGNAIDLSQVTVTGADQVNTTVPGTYAVTYSYTDAYGNTKTQVVTITVQAATTTDNNGSDIGSTTGDTDTTSQADTITTTKDPTASAKDGLLRTVATADVVQPTATTTTQTSGTTTQVAAMQPKLQATSSAPKAASDQAKKLPQTNDSSADSAVILGAIMLSMTGLFSFFNKKRRTR